MTGLETQISGDWFDIRERIRKTDEILALLWPDEANTSGLFSRVATALEAAFEGGIVEYKNNVVRRIGSVLEEAAFSSEFVKKIPNLVEETQALIYATALERGILAQEVRLVPDRDESEDAEPATMSDAHIKSIIADVKEIVANDPSARMNNAIKNILLQLNKYRDEVNAFSSLKAKSDPDRLEAITKNFQASFGNIFDSIRRNYSQFQEEQRLSMRRERGDVIKRTDTTALQKHLASEIEDFSRVRSTLVHVSREHYHMREPLVKLGESLAQTEALLEEEVALAENASGSEMAGAALLRLLAREIARILRGE